MKKKKIMIISTIVVVIILLISVSYALYNYSLLGVKNNQLVLGDIYMRYRENNQLTLSDNDIYNANILANTKNTTLYQVNPEIIKQSNQELNQCIIWFEKYEYEFDEGSTAESFCRGTGTSDGLTIQQLIDEGSQEESFMINIGELLLASNVMILQNDVYIANPVMATQNMDVLNSCINYFSNADFDSGGSNYLVNNYFCTGIEVAENGYTFQGNLDNDNFFTDENIQEMLSLNIINKKDTSYTKFQLNPIMQEQKVNYENVLISCINIYDNDLYYDFDEGSTSGSFCQGTGTRNGLTIQEDLDFWIADAKEYDYDFLEDGGQELLDAGVILPNGDSYIVNSEMASQTLNENQELKNCIEYFYQKGIESDLYGGSTLESFCQGTGMYHYAYWTMDIYQDLYGLPDETNENLSILGIMVKDGETYKVNPVLKTQKLNELDRCIVFVNSMGVNLDEGSTTESFCQGTGTADNGKTFEQLIDKLPDEDQMFLLRNNITLPIVEDVPYFEFEISGKNTYSDKDIYYDIILNHGDSHATRTERIRDDLLRFSLIKIVDGTEIVVFENMAYDDLNNKSILRETIAKNTMDEVNVTYRLYMGFYEGIRVGLVGPNSNKTIDYDFDTWNNQVFASVKVNVKGGLVE